MVYAPKIRCLSDCLLVSLIERKNQQGNRGGVSRALPEVNEMATAAALSLDSRQSQMDWLLEQICLAGQLTTPMYEAAKAKYEAVGSLLAAPDSELALFRPEVFPQGSMSLGTTNRPLKGEEFDLDVVCHLRYCPGATPAAVYDAVYRRIHSSGVYREILEKEGPLPQAELRRKFPS